MWLAARPSGGQACAQHPARRPSQGPKLFKIDSKTQTLDEPWPLAGPQRARLARVRPLRPTPYAPSPSPSPLPARLPRMNLFRLLGASAKMRSRPSFFRAQADCPPASAPLHPSCAPRLLARCPLPQGTCPTWRPSSSFSTRSRRHAQPGVRF
jgi:hypothetical protein